MEVQCKLCNHFIRIEEFERHYNKCSSVKYIQTKTKELYNQDVSYSDLFRLDIAELNKKYFQVLNMVYEKTQDNKERRRIENIIYGADHNLKDCV